MKILDLTLKKKWFDMILSGEKKEEYREIKPYWEKRFAKHYDAVRLRNGYHSNAPEMTIMLKSLKKDIGIAEWGAPLCVEVYILSLGDIIDQKNIK